MVVAHRGFEWRAERPEEATFVGQKWGWTASQPGDWAELQFDSRDAAVPTDAAAGAADPPAAEAAAGAAARDEEEEEETDESAAERGAAAGNSKAGQEEEEEEEEDSSSSSTSTGSDRGGSNSTAAGSGASAPKAKRLPNAEVLLSHLRSYEGMGVAQVRRGGLLACAANLENVSEHLPCLHAVCLDVHSKLAHYCPRPLAGAVRIRVHLPHHLPGRHLGAAGLAAVHPPLQGALRA